MRSKTTWPLNTNDKTTLAQYKNLLKDRMSNMVRAWTLEHDVDLYTYYLLQYLSLVSEMPTAYQTRLLDALQTLEF